MLFCCRFVTVNACIVFLRHVIIGAHHITKIIRMLFADRISLLDPCCPVSLRRLVVTS